MTIKALPGAATAILLALAAWAPAPRAAAACSFTRVAELPVTMRDLRPVVHAKINGQDADFLLDTGAFYSMFSPGAAARYKLSMSPAAAGFTVQGVGGEADVRIGTARQITFAGAPMKGLQFIVGGPEFDHDVAGILGQNFLHNADVEYDLANGVVRLFVAKDCQGVGLAYWKGVSANVLPLERTDDRDPHINGKVAVNGRVVTATFDTGAPVSELTADAAQRIGLPLSGAGVENGGTTGGIGRGVSETFIVPVSSFEVGGEQILRTRLRVGRFRMTGSDMLLGADFFLSHRVMVANSQRRLYFTYNGGAVFNLAQNSAARPSASASGAEPAAAATMSADAYARRAAASLSRFDHAAAIADLTQAIRLEPQNPTYLTLRAKARLSTDLKGAQSDLDAALKLEPRNAAALIARGYIRMRAGDNAGADADLAAAIDLKPDSLETAQAVDGIYLRARRYKQAIAVLDRWIAAHPKDQSAWEALNARCWDRTMWNQQLDEALADCDAAVRGGRRNSMALDSRGMAHLRLSQYQLAVADYDAAIKAQSRQAWSFIGRGLAREKLGDKPGAEADFKQALAINPHAAERARRAGFESDLLPKGVPGKTPKASPTGDDPDTDDDD